MEYFDAHNHLQEEVLIPHLPGVMARARQAGVRRMICNGTHEGDWERVLELSREYEEIVPCFGLHPWFVQERSARWVERLEEYLDAAPAAVGEIGLDRWVQERDEVAQEEVFRAQLDVARRRGLPVMVHCLRAWGWLLKVLESEGVPEAGMVIHAYGGSAELLPELAAMGAYFSFGGSVLDERRQKAREALKRVVLQRLLVETDAPALPPPEAYREHVVLGDGGEAYNEPANLPAILRGLAEVRGETEEVVRRVCWENGKRLLSAWVE